MGFIVSGNVEHAPGLAVENFVDTPSLRLKRGEDYTARPAREWIRAIMLHTTRGIPAGRGDPPAPILPGRGPNVQSELKIARYWSGDGRNAGAHLIVDADGSIAQTCDLRDDATYHCPRWNTGSIGIEIFQTGRGELYETQLDTVVQLVDWLTARFGIQRMIPHRYLGPVARLCDDGGDVTGVIGHRDAARNRGPGDPGSAIFYRLGRAGYEPVDYSVIEDRDIWRRRQRQFGITPPDGIAGPGTCAALERAGKPRGMWVPRPVDSTFTFERDSSGGS